MSWEEELFDASFDGIAIHLLDIDDDLSRTTIRHEYPNTDGAHVVDTGAAPRTCDCSVVFMDDEQGTSIEHAKRLLAAFDGEAKLFVHPIHGSWMAKPEGVHLRANASERDYMTMQVTFVEDGVDVTREDLAASPSARASVDDAAAELTRRAPTTTGEDAIAAADSWESPTVSAQQINRDLSHLANQIQQETDRLELAADVANYPTIRAYQLLHNNLRNLAAAVIASRPKLTSYTVPVSGPVLAVAQQLYGGRAAIERADELLELNSLPDPAWIPEGTVLTVVQPS